MEDEIQEGKTAKEVLKVPQISYKGGGGGVMSFMPRCSKTSVKAVSQAKSKQPPKILISRNQLADE